MKIILFAKAHVRAHTRVTAAGKVVQVNPYSTRTVASSHVTPTKTKGARDAHTMDLFSGHATAHVDPKAAPAPAKGGAESPAKVPAESKGGQKPGGGGEGGGIRKGDVVEILPEWQDNGDDQFTWVALSDAEKGRIDIQPSNHPMAIKPKYTLRVDQVRRIGSLPPPMTMKEWESKPAGYRGVELVDGKEMHYVLSDAGKKSYVVITDPPQRKRHKDPKIPFKTDDSLLNKKREKAPDAPPKNALVYIRKKT